MLDRVPPQNIEAEQSVLGSVLIEQGAIAKVSDILQPEDFYREAHRLIFRAAMILFERGEAIDFITVTDTLRRDDAVEQAGGIGHERIWSWLHNTGLTLEQAADALGISRRMLIYYRDGEKPIPRSIWLACLGWEAVKPNGRSLPLHIPSLQEYAALHPA